MKKMKKNLSSNNDCLPGREWYWQQQQEARDYLEGQIKGRSASEVQITRIALDRYSEPAAVPVEMLKNIARELDLHPHDLVTWGVSTLRLTVHDLHEMQVELGVLSY